MNSTDKQDLIRTVLQKTLEFRAAVGLSFQEETSHDSFFSSEIIELLTAESHADVADALADAAVIMAGHYLDGKPYYDFEKALLGLEKQAILNKVNLLEAFNIVMVSNMSKVCTSSRIQETNHKYNKEGVMLHWKERENGLWACYCANDMPDKPRGKLLKTVTYVEPDWSGDTWQLKDDPHHWNKPENLPPIGLFLILRLTDGSEITGLRTSYVKDRLGDLGYYSAGGESVNSSLIKEWRYV